MVRYYRYANSRRNDRNEWWLCVFTRDIKCHSCILLTYLGVVSGLSLGYILGKIFGTKVLDKLMKRKGEISFEISTNGREVWSLCVSHKLLYTSCKTYRTILVGMNNMSFKTYALYSYTTGFVWTLVYFVLGALFGKHIESIVAIAIEYGVYFGVIVL